MNVMLTVLCLSLGVRGLPQMSCTSSSTMAMTLEELERSVYNVARIKEVPPTVIINRLLRKAKSRQRIDRMRNRNPLQEMALKELLSSVAQMPKSGMRESLPPPSREKPPKFGMLPDARLSPPSNSRPMPIAPGAPYSVSNMPGSPPIFLPARGPPVFKPPPGVTIRVNPGGAAAMLPDVTVTISPMMTVVEALRQADAKFRSSLGVPESADEIMSLSYAPYASCYVISRFGDLSATEHHAWKISVSDNRGEVIYESICLPSRNEVPVKPGTTISLTYT